MKEMVFEFEYFWAILLLFIMERICCLQEQFDKDFANLPDPERSSESLNMEDISYRDNGLKLGFLRLSRISHITMLLSLVYFCNICLWFVMTKKASPRTFRYKFRVMI